MAPQCSKLMFAEGDDDIMLEAVIGLLKRGVDVDDIFRMVRSSDWDWNNEAIPVNLVKRRNLYVRIVKLVHKQGRTVFASTSYKNRFKRIMIDAKGIDHVIGRKAKIFPNEDTKKCFRELYEKWHTERRRRNRRGRSHGNNGAVGAAGMSRPAFDRRGDKDQREDDMSDGERTIVMDDEDIGGNRQPVLNPQRQRQLETKNVLLSSIERQAIIKMIAELLRVYSPEDVLAIVMYEDWANGSVLHAQIAFRAQRKSKETRPYQKYWKEKVVPHMLSWNGKVNPCVFRTGVSPVHLTPMDLLSVRDFVAKFRSSFVST